MANSDTDTGECIFYHLYDLCGFDPVLDLSIDAMHTIVLNTVKTELEAQLTPSSFSV